MQGMTLTLSSPKPTLTSITARTVISLPRLPWTRGSSHSLPAAPGRILQNQVKEGAGEEEREEGFKLCS